MVTHFPDPADLLNFTLTITPDEGMPVSASVFHPLVLTDISARHVQGWRIRIFLCHQHELSP